MTYDGPRRAPLTKEERERNARAANRTQTAEGATSSARPVDRPSPGQKWRHDVPAGGLTGQVLTKSTDDDYAADWEAVPTGGVPIGSAFRLDLTSRTATVFVIDPSVTNVDTGDTSAISYDATTPGLSIDAAGWYQAAAVIEVTTAPTDPLAIQLALSGANGPDCGAFLPVGASWTELTATVPAFYVDASAVPNTISARVFNPGGATVAFAYLYVVKLA